MRPSITRIQAGLALLCMALGAVALDVTVELRPDDDYEGRVEPGEVHTFIVPIIAGSRLTVDLDVEAEDGDPLPVLVLQTPEGGLIGSASGHDVRIRRILAESGRYRIELRSGASEGDYRLSLETELPTSVGGGEDEVTTGGGAAVHLDVPAGSTVAIEVERVSGAPPAIAEIRDGTGRSLGFTIRRATNRRIRTHPVPVTAPGGIYVEVEARDGTSGTWEVEAKLDEDDDESPGHDGDDSPRRIVLFLAPGADPAAVAAALGYELKEVRDGHIVVETPEGREGFEDEDARNAVGTRPEVVGAEGDALSETPEGSQSNGLALGSSLGRTDFERQPALLMVRSEKAHVRATGRGVVVAVLDTGIDGTHSLFSGRTLAGFDFVSGDAEPSEERNGIDDDGDGETDEGYGHGTFVAGLVLGGAPDATILPVRVLDSEGRGESSDIAAGIEYAVGRGVDVINLSLGARQQSEVLRGAVRYAMSHGVVVVASTGNGSDLTAVDYPSGVAGVLAVTAVDAQARRAPFANASPATALAAPGVDLVGPHPGERWATWSGTSFATALTSAGTALLLERRPTLSPARVRKKVVRKAKSLRRTVPRRERKLMGGGRLDLAGLAR